MLGQSFVQALQASVGVTSRLGLKVTTLSQAKTAMDRGEVYATLVIPATFTASALLDAGDPAPAGTAPPARPTVQLLENSRLGSLGVSLAAGVLTPAVHEISEHLGTKSTTKATASVRINPVLAAQVADPVTLATVTYRPLPSNTAIGLSAFYTSLIAILGGFLGGTVINSSIDGALGYATTALGPKWKMRMPLPISRRQTLLTKWLIALVAAPLLTAVIIAVAAGAFGMDAPDIGVLWLLLSLATLMVATGTLALLAASGPWANSSPWSSLSTLARLVRRHGSRSSPPRVLPGRQRRRAAPPATRRRTRPALLRCPVARRAGPPVLVLGIELAFWVMLGLAFTSWYDHKKLDRLSPEIIAYVHQAVAQRHQA